MQPEGEDREPGVRVAHLVAGQQLARGSRRGSGRRRARSWLGESRGAAAGAVDGRGVARTSRSSVDVARPKRRLDPDATAGRRRTRRTRSAVRRRPRLAAASAATNAGSSTSSSGVARSQRLADDLARARPRRRTAARRPRATSACRSSSVPSVASVADVPTHCSSRRPRRLAHPADEQRDVGALAAAVGVQLVEDEEAQAARPARPVRRSRPGQDQLEHHVVGEQDVRRVARGSPARSSSLSWPV